MNKDLATQVTKVTNKTTQTLEKHVITVTNKTISSVSVRKRSLMIKIGIKTGIKGLNKATATTKMVVTLNTTQIKATITVTVIVLADAIIATALDIILAPVDSGKKMSI